MSIKNTGTIATRIVAIGLLGVSELFSSGIGVIKGWVVGTGGALLLSSVDSSVLEGVGVGFCKGTIGNSLEFRIV